MINLDLGKVFHPQVTNVPPPFLPGLFFEICIALANPELAQKVVKGAGGERHLQLFVALFLAFVIGTALIHWVRFVQIQLINITSIFFRRNWRSRIKYWRLSRAQAKQAAKQGQIGATGVPWAAAKNWASASVDPAPLKHAREEWKRAAAVLLKRYGIETDPPWYWPIWSGFLGISLDEDFRGSLPIIALNATGWGGLLAIHFAPALCARFFTLFCLFFILYGLLHDFQVARKACDPAAQWAIALQRVVRELREQPENKKPAEGPTAT